MVALSSAEAELNALVKMFSESIGLRNTLREFGKEYGVVLYTDSSACNGIVHRSGCGKVKHLETRQLWIQGHVDNKEIIVKKVAREYNCSDALTHSWSATDGYRHLSNVGVEWR